MTKKGIRCCQYVCLVQNLIVSSVVKVSSRMTSWRNILCNKAFIDVFGPGARHPVALVGAPTGAFSL